MSVNISHPSSDEINLRDLVETMDNEDSPHPALLNDLIIQRVFKNLCTNDFRNCRRVCQKWKSVGEASFKKKVRLCLHLLNNTVEGHDCDLPYEKSEHPPPTNLTQFFQMSQSEFPFTAVSFRNLLPWPPAELSDFFSTEGRFITDLRLWNVALKAGNYNTENNEILDSYDLTALLGGNENLKRLSIKRTRYLTINSTTRWIVAFDNLETIKHIKLERCTIDLNTDLPLIISPIELGLFDVLFLRENKSLENILLNEVVSFENMKALYLDTNGAKNTKVSLDVSGRAFLKKAIFWKVDFVNFAESGWKIEDLNWSFIPFDKTTKMVIKQMEINFGECLLKMLPNSLEKLSIGNCASIVEFRESTLLGICKPHIKRLKLRDIALKHMCWPYFTQCFPNLEELVIDADFQRETIDVDMIPPSVKSLTLKGHYKLEGRGVHVLDELCLDNVLDDNVDFVVPTLRLFQPKLLRLTRVVLKHDDPIVKPLLETSIPRIELQFISFEGFIHLKENYTFESIDKKNKLGVIVNAKGSTISIRFCGNAIW